MTHFLCQSGKNGSTNTIKTFCFKLHGLCCPTFQTAAVYANETGFEPENKENFDGPYKQVSGKQFARAHFDKINSLCLALTGKPFAEVAVNDIDPIKRVVNC